MNSTMSKVFKKLSLLKLAVIILLTGNILISDAQTAMFLHHSTGNGVFYDGNVAAYISNYNSANGTNIQVDEMYYPNVPWDWTNYPYDYWKLWVDGSCNNSDADIECLESIASRYNLVIFKHCFPGAQVLDDLGTPDVSSYRQSLENYKLQYRALRTKMDNIPGTKFLVWTLAPLHQLATNSEDAARANEFVQWVKNTWLSEDGNTHANIFVFDFYSEVAELNASPINGQQYCLRYDYESSHTGSDSHPNSLANQTVGPIFAQTIIDVLINNYTKVDSLEIKGKDGVSAIKAGDSLQFEVIVYPEGATNKSVNWSVTSGTGTATINSFGVLKAISTGIVTAKATSIDNSTKSGSQQITILENSVSVETVSVIKAGGGTALIQNGNSMQFFANILPENATNKSVTWSVVNGSGSAIINQSGLLTATSVGDITVIATANDGSLESGELAVTIFAVDNEAPTVPILTNIEVVSSSQIDINWLESTDNFMVKGYYIFRNDNVVDSTALITYSDINLNPTTEYTYFLRSFDYSGNISEKSAVISATTLTTSTDDQIISKFKIFPNPASDRLNVIIYSDNSENVLIELTNINGIVIKAWKIETESNKNILLDISGIDPGFYLMILKTVSGKTTIPCLKN